MHWATDEYKNHLTRLTISAFGGPSADVICECPSPLIELTWPVEAVLDVSQCLGAGQGDAVLLAVVEGGDGAELGVQLDEEVVEGAHPLDVGKVAQAVKVNQG